MVPLGRQASSAQQLVPGPGLELAMGVAWAAVLCWAASLAWSSSGSRLEIEEGPGGPSVLSWDLVLRLPRGCTQQRVGPAWL